MIFHKHNWKLIAKTYAPPCPKAVEGVAALLEKSMFGLTTMLWGCSICSEIRREELLGKEESHE